MKKVCTWSLCMMLLLVASLFIGCADVKKDNNTFTFATWAAGDELKQFTAIVDKVNQDANGKYKIEVLSVPSDYYIKLSTFIAAKKTPAFFWLTQELISKYAELGVIADITEPFSKSMNLKAELFYPGVLKSATYKNKHYGLPWIANPLIVYYNKNLFDQAGVPYPSATGGWTWDEFIEISKTLSVTKKDVNGNNYKQYGYIVDGWPNIETFIWAGGGDIIAENGIDVLIDSSASIKGLDILHNILSAGISPAYSEIASLGSNNVWFEKQRVAMFMGGIQDNFEIKQTKLPENEKFEIGYAPMPVCLDGKAHSFDWTASTVMNRKIIDNPYAYEALEKLTLAFFKWKIAPPVADEVDQVVVIDPLKKPALESIQICLNNARSANYVPEWNEINNKLWLKLYNGMLNDVNYDYQKEAKVIAEYTRKLIGNRK